jgi:hypothetical protein
MSRRATPIPPLLAFADPVQNLWGAMVGEDASRAVIGRLDEPAGGSCGRLLAEPITGNTVATDDQLELVRVTGQVTLPGNSAVELSAGGIRYPGASVERLASARLLVSWFPDEQAVALLALRPDGARGHDRDTLSVACLGERDGVSVFDPRLSSTYTRNGSLRRVGVELWLGETEEGDQHPHRVAGEASGSDGHVAAEEVVGEAYGLRCHSRGEDGAGVYLQIRPA